MSERPPTSLDGAGPQELSAEQADAMIRSRRYVALLMVVAVIGVLVSLAAWCFLEAIHQIQQEMYTHLPHAAAAVLVWENAWAAPFASAVRRSGGRLVASGRIPIQALASALEVDEAVATEGV